MKQYGFVPTLERPTAVALGFFDGVHRGHRAVVRGAFQTGLVPTVFTFSAGSFFPKAKRHMLRLTTDQVKCQLLRQEGIQIVVNVNFSDVKNMDAEEFAAKVLFERMKAKVVSCGKDFRFGKHVAGNVDLLRQVAKRYRADVRIVSFLEEGGARISSSRIRRALECADICAANRLLGYEYYWDLPVVHGNGQGRKYGFSTMNQIFPPYCLVPRYGVYASVAAICGKKYLGVTNIGIKPTVQISSQPLAETHVLGFDRDVYGKSVKVALIEFLRPEQKFASVEQLKQQVAEDIQRAQQVFERHSVDREAR